MKYIGEFEPTVNFFDKQLEALRSDANIILYGGAAGGGKTETAKGFIIRNIIPEATMCFFRRNQKDLEHKSGILERVAQEYCTSEGRYRAVRKPEWLSKSRIEVTQSFNYCIRNKISITDPRFPFEVIKHIRGVRKAKQMKLQFEIRYLFDLYNERGEYIADPNKPFEKIHVTDLKEGVLYDIDTANFREKITKKGLYTKIKRFSEVAEKIYAVKGYVMARPLTSVLKPDSNKVYEASLYYAHLNESTAGGFIRQAGAEISHAIVDEAQEIVDDFMMGTVFRRNRVSAKYAAIHPDSKARVFLNCNPKQCWIYHLIKDKLLDRHNDNVPKLDACKKTYYCLTDDSGHLALIDRDNEEDQMLANLHFEKYNTSWDDLLTFKFIPARSIDNIHLPAEYERTVQGTCGSETAKKQLLEGAWVFGNSASLFPRDAFKRYDASMHMMEALHKTIDMYLVTIDTAHKSDKQHDNSAIYLYGVEFFPEDTVFTGLPFKLYVLDGGILLDELGNKDNSPLTVIDKCMNFLEQYKDYIFRPSYMKCRANDKNKTKIYNTGIIVAEAASTGITLGDMIKKKYQYLDLGSQLYEGSVSRGASKYNRARIPAQYVRKGCVFVPSEPHHVQKLDGTAAKVMRDTPMTQELLDEITVFGESTVVHDDRVDCLVFAIERVIQTIDNYAGNRAFKELNPVKPQIIIEKPKTLSEYGKDYIDNISKVIFKN